MFRVVSFLQTNNVLLNQLINACKGVQQKYQLINWKLCRWDVYEFFWGCFSY